MTMLGLMILNYGQNLMMERAVIILILLKSIRKFINTLQVNLKKQVKSENTLPKTEELAESLLDSLQSKRNLKLTSKRKYIIDDLHQDITYARVAILKNTYPINIKSIE